MNSNVIKLAVFEKITVKFLFQTIVQCTYCFSSIIIATITFSFKKLLWSSLPFTFSISLSCLLSKNKAAQYKQASKVTLTILSFCPHTKSQTNLLRERPCEDRGSSQYVRHWVKF